MKKMFLLAFPLFTFGSIACVSERSDEPTGESGSEIAYRKLECHELTESQCGLDPSCAWDVCTTKCGSKDAGNAPESADDGGVHLLPCKAPANDTCEAQTTAADCESAAAKQGRWKGCAWDDAAKSCTSAELQ